MRTKKNEKYNRMNFHSLVEWILIFLRTNIIRSPIKIIGIRRDGENPNNCYENSMNNIEISNKFFFICNFRLIIQWTLVLFLKKCSHNKQCQNTEKGGDRRFWCHTSCITKTGLTTTSISSQCGTPSTTRIITKTVRCSSSTSYSTRDTRSALFLKYKNVKFHSCVKWHKWIASYLQDKIRY